jgi:hypothetical protein
MRHRPQPPHPRRRIGDLAWWVSVLLTATVGVVLIRLEHAGLGWALLVTAIGLGLLRSPTP